MMRLAVSGAGDMGSVHAGRADPSRIDAVAARAALQVTLAAQESFGRGGERVVLP